MSHLAWLTFCVLAACTKPVSSRPCPAIAPITATPVTAPPDSVAIVFVIQGEEIWMGNDDIEPEIDPDDKTGLRPNPSRYLGILKPWKRAFEAADFGSITVPATAAVITYSDRVSLRVPMGPLEHVDAAAFGSQRDYYGHLGRSLVRAIEHGVDELESTAAARKILVIIGDGTDTDMETAIGKLKTLRREITKAGIVTSVIVYKGPLSDPGQLLRDWHGFVPVTSFDDIEHVLGRIKRRASRPPATSAGRPRCETC